MKNPLWLVMVIGLLGSCVCGEEKVTTGNCQYRVITKTVTNDVDKSTYDTRTNGYAWVEKEDLFPYYKYATVSVNNNSWTCITNQVISANQNYVGPGKSGPDPFQEKIEVKYFTVVQEKLYELVVGPLSTKYATQYTVLKRWRHIKKQKINMTESEETLQE